MSKKGAVHPNRVSGFPQFAPERVGHGGTVRTEPERLRQPQDGAAPLRSKLATIAAHLPGDFFQEPEDARLTGGTRSLKRRLLGLNMGSKLRGVPAMVAGPIARPKVA